LALGEALASRQANPPDVLPSPSRQKPSIGLTLALAQALASRARRQPTSTAPVAPEALA
jgi:hypothetical protein